MFRTWHHGHSIGVGVLGGLLLTQHAWLIAIGCLTIGFLIGRFWLIASRTARRAAERIEETHQSRLASQRLDRSVKRTKARHEQTGWWRTKRGLKEALEREYARGVSEGVAASVRH